MNCNINCLPTISYHEDHCLVVKEKQTYVTFKKFIPTFDPTVRPSISYTTDSVAASVDSPILLPCDVLLGNPKPTITWYRGSDPIVPNYDIHVTPNGALAFRSVSMADGGQYRCVASNVAGDHSITVTLTVQSK